MKLCNFLPYDPKLYWQRVRAGRKIRWNEFSKNPSYLHEIAQNIINGYGSSPTSTVEEEEEEFPEGKILYRQHRSRERNNVMIQQAKREAMEQGRLKCMVCGFDFYEEYGELGRGFIECHHTIPVSEYTEGMKTKIKDLALVCSNCHRMLHRRRPWPTIDELSVLIKF